MENEEKIERLRAIVNAKTMSKDDRQFVKDLCDELNEQKPAKANCRACWLEVALNLYRSLNGSKDEEVAKNTERKYILKSGVDLLFGNIRVNEATLTDEMAERILARGFERKYFAKICE